MPNSTSAKIEAVALSLMDPFADRQSRVPVSHRRNPLVSPPSSEFRLFFPLIFNNLRYTKQPLAFMLSTFARTANNASSLSSFPQNLFFGYGLFTPEGHQDGE